jgi:hypothetical protein
VPPKSCEFHRCDLGWSTCTRTFSSTVPFGCVSVMCGDGDTSCWALDRKVRGITLVGPTLIEWTNGMVGGICMEESVWFPRCFERSIAVKSRVIWQWFYYVWPPVNSTRLRLVLERCRGTVPAPWGVAPNLIAIMSVVWPHWQSRDARNDIELRYV